jgi:cephalosporin hydroxylase
MSFIQDGLKRFTRVWSWRFLLCFGLLTILVWYVGQYSKVVYTNYYNNSTSSVLTSTSQPHNTSSISACACYPNKTWILKQCSESEFVSSRAKQRIAADKNAVFVHDDRVIDLGGNYFVSVDDILFGYDVLFEKDVLFGAGSWLGAQFQSSPEDAIVLQQLIWKIKPDLIIDLGTNAGGSALFFASIMSFYNDAGIVLTIDLKPFSQNWLGSHQIKCKDCVNPSENKLWKKYVQFIQGSTTDAEVIAKVKQYVLSSTTVFLSHDADHNSHTIYQDLLNYAPFVSINSYFVVQDTKLDRIQKRTNGPLAAVRRFLQYQNSTENHANYTFIVDRSAEVYYYTQHAYGWLKRVK